MKPAAIQSALPVVSDRLAPRLTALGVTVVCLESTGRAHVQGPCSALERLVLEAPAFAAAVRTAWTTLNQEQPQAVALWPGLWLAPLPVQRRRRPGPDSAARPLHAALLLGPALLTSDQLRLVCDGQHLDFAATVAEVNAAKLVDQAQADRLAATLAWMQQDAVEIERRHDEIHTLSQQLGESYEELSLLYKFSTSMTVDQPPAQFLTEACVELQQTVGLRWMALQLVENEPRLHELAGQIFTAGPVGCDPGVLQRIGRMLMARYPAGAGNGAPLVIDDAQTVHIPYLGRIARHLLVVALQREDRVLGILFGGDKIDGTHIGSVDSKLCNSLANSLAMFLENMMLYEDVQAMFLGALHALTSSIDAKDKYTHGHSERVALMSRQLAAAAGLDEHTVERVYLAGLVHDVGKIGVPEAVLCKAGRLTPEEFGLVKLHPEIGARILQDIRQMQDLIPGVLHHHERWDGQGYPAGLAGDRIPLFGRLIALADSFDAMSSNRTYRQSLTRQQVVDEIRRCAGVQFDPQLAQVFLGLDFTPFDQLVQKHMHDQSLPAAYPLSTGGPSMGSIPT